MSRMVAKRAPVREGFTGMRFSEMIVIALVIGLVVAGARYYFLIYRKSPGFVLGQYMGAVKRGNVENQYALIDNDDKRYFPTQKAYAQGAPQAYGYTERISNVVLKDEKIDPKKPHLATIKATISVRKSGQKVYETGTDTAEDTYTLRKDKEGNWKVWLGRSVINLLKIPPSPSGSPL